jgi:hypothetical protein
MDKNEDLVTGTPVTKTPLALRAVLAVPEYWKEIFIYFQRLIMVILTVAVVLSLYKASEEIKALRVQTTRIANIAENGCRIAEETRTEIYRQIEEIQRDGIKLHFRIF